MISFPKNLESFLLSYIKESFYRGTRRETFIDRPFHKADLYFFSKGVSKLSELFTEERGRLNSGYLNQPALRAAYLLYFLPINFAKARFVLQKLPEEFWRRKNFRVLDLGSGPGSASLAFLSLLAEKNPKASVECVLSDQNKNILEDALALKRCFDGPGKIQFQTIATEAKTFRLQGEYDLILLSHILNEWVQDSAMDRAEWLLPRMEDHLCPMGIVAIMEPALKRPTRELMGLRDHLLESKDFSVLAPCLHQEICPMLAATHNDWCHFYVEWEEPAYLKELDRLVDNDNRFLKVAYLLIGRTDATKKNLPLRRPFEFRVVSNRMARRGKTELVLCGIPGRIKLTRMDRDRTAANADLERTQRGDLIELKNNPLRGFEVERKLHLGRKDVFKKL